MEKTGEKWKVGVMILNWITRMGRCVPAQVNMNMVTSIMVPNTISTRGIS
jgi:hypothetical protein